MVVYHLQISSRQMVRLVDPMVLDCPRSYRCVGNSGHYKSPTSDSQVAKGHLSILDWLLSPKRAISTFCQPLRSFLEVDCESRYIMWLTLILPNYLCSHLHSRKTPPPHLSVSMTR